jgi:hypothetical protein
VGAKGQQFNVSNPGATEAWILNNGDLVGELREQANSAGQGVIKIG